MLKPIDIHVDVLSLWLLLKVLHVYIRKPRFDSEISPKMDLEKMRVVDLENKLKDLGLSQYGKKSDLVKRLKDHYYAPTNADPTSSDEDDESSGLVVQQLANHDDTDELSDLDGFDAEEEDKDDKIGDTQAKNKRAKGKSYTPYVGFKCVEDALKALESDWLDGRWKRCNTTPGRRATTIWFKCKQCALSLKLMVTKDEEKRVVRGGWCARAHMHLDGELYNRINIINKCISAHIIR